MSGYEDLVGLLAPRGQAPGIGSERGSPTTSGIARYVSPHGSTRYVLYEGGEPVAALQVVSRDGRRATIANVYTLPSHRRRGLAARLLTRARRDFTSVEHSAHLSDEGRAWKQSVRDRRRRRR